MSEAQSLHGSLEVHFRGELVRLDGESVTFLFTGTTLNAKKAVSPRVIPLADIESVDFQPASTWKPGHLRVVLRGDTNPVQRPHFDVNTVSIPAGRGAKVDAEWRSFSEALLTAVGSARGDLTENATSTESSTPADPRERERVLAKAAKPGRKKRTGSLLNDATQKVTVAGTSFRQSALRKATNESAFRLEADPRNTHDHNAVKVLLGVEQIGFLPKEIAKRFSQSVQAWEIQKIWIFARAEVGMFEDGGKWVSLFLPPADVELKLSESDI